MNSRLWSVHTLLLSAALLTMLLLLAGAFPITASPASLAAPSPLPRAATFFNSGWVSISPGQVITLHHNLGQAPEQLGVELWFRDTTPGGIGINRAGYGGLEISVPTPTWHGAYWQRLTANTIQVHRLPQDEAADQVNVKVWVAPTPDYDSGWRTVAPGSAYYFNHNLGITETELAVSMWFSGTERGIHQYAYGGLTDGENEYGAYWSWLSTTTVRAYRRPDDTDIEQIRMVVTHAETPDYDSLVALGGWQNLAVGTAFTFTHGLNWNPGMLIVQTECRDTAAGGAPNHQLWAGGDEWFHGLMRGTHVQNLTANTVQVVRQISDQECDQGRVVVYRRGLKLYLPLILSTFGAP